MITKDDIAKYIQNPELVKNVSSEDLKKIIEIYPYCEMLIWIYLRLLYINNDVLFEDELLKYGMHISNRKSFYEYITHTHREDEIAETTTEEELVNISKVNYFEIKNNPEQQLSLKELAEKLRKARLERQKKNEEEKKEIPEKTKSESTLTNINNTYHQKETEKGETIKEEKVDIRVETEPENDISDEEKVQKLIKEKKYSSALAILRSINLNNPKKSVYFALQIKFLETIINNNNKIS